MVLALVAIVPRDHARCRIDRQPGGQALRHIVPDIAINIKEALRGWYIDDGLCIKIGLRGQAANRNGEVIHRSNSHGNSRGGETAFAIADRIGDRIRAVEVRVGHIADGAIGVDGDRAIGRRGRRDRQRIAVNIGIIGEDRNGDRRIFADIHAVAGLQPARH